MDKLARCAAQRVGGTHRRRRGYGAGAAVDTRYATVVDHAPYSRPSPQPTLGAVELLVGTEGSAALRKVMLNAIGIARLKGHK